ncbi:DUF659 domain-containing protein [Cephalotus follicularis]|uniref:DUF659 domain-containing protein n=1 Tax=Cephalotus follicularis TaxID=3775 RepID=A0A1Q3D9Z6_CEPFO|nr:DUF659 domain-containing protein [Cephalotus follicularis]
MDTIVAFGHGYKLLTYHSMHVNLLQDAKKEAQLVVDSYKRSWEQVGCTLMVDGWTDNSQRSLINFLLYCSDGVCFLKSVDASNVVKDAGTLCNLFEEVVLWIGPSNIIHIVTDNGSNYTVAGRLLCDKYESITWSPCVAYCLNLVLKDISEMDHIVSLAKRAFELKKFMYNHSL